MRMLVETVVSRPFGYCAAGVYGQLAWYTSLVSTYCFFFPVHLNARKVYHTTYKFQTAINLVPRVLSYPTLSLSLRRAGRREPWERGWTAIALSRTILGSLSNDEGDSNENDKKAIDLDWQNNNFASRFFIHLLAVVGRLPSESSYFQVLSKTGTQDNNFLFLFLNFDKVLYNSTRKTFANIWRIKRDGISAKKFEAERIHFLSNVPAAFAVVVA